MLIPAHNEDRLIGKTIDSVLNQSLVPDRIVVVADNCTDRTVEIARAKGVEVIETVGNTAKKAGALNQGFRHVRKADVVVQVDADITFDRHFVREMVAALRADRQAGAVTGRVGVQPFGGGGPMRRFLWAMQRLEYYYYDSMKIENRGRVWCISGTGGAYRGSVLRRLSVDRPGPWDEDSIVEDYTLTLEIEELGWRTGSALHAFAWSDTMETPRQLWRQRMRWNAGTFTEWRRRPSSGPMRSDRWTFYRGLVLVALNPLFLMLTVATLLLGVAQVSLTSGVIAAFFAVDRLYRLRYVPKRTVADVLFAVTVVPEFAYRMFVDLNLFVALARSAFRRRTPLSW
jgi:cellulose synthase/poly-beta-1,6-N-acetylglucosamine synthase-like glycosyltransferase